MQLFTIFYSRSGAHCPFHFPDKYNPTYQYRGRGAGLADGPRLVYALGSSTVISNFQLPEIHPMIRSVILAVSVRGLPCGRATFIAETIGLDDQGVADPLPG